MTSANTIASITARCLSYRKTDPPMQRAFVVVRVETDGGIVGWGEASSNWGHSYPTVVETVVRDVIAPNLEGADAFAIRARLGQMHVLLDGYLGLGGPVAARSSAAVEIALWDLLGKTHGALDRRAARRRRRVDPAVRHRHDDVRGVSRVARPLLRPGARRSGSATSRCASASTPTPMSSWCAW